MRKYAWFIVGLALALLLPTACKKQDKPCIDCATAPATSTATPTASTTGTFSATPIATNTRTVTPTATTSGRIYFSTDRDGNYEVYYCNPDGTGPIRVTNTAGECEYMGDIGFGKILHNRVASACTGNWSIWTMDSDGSNAVSIAPQTPNCWGSRPVWFSDGTKYIYQERGTSCSGMGAYTNYMITRLANGTGPVTVLTAAGEDLESYAANVTAGKILFMRNPAFNGTAHTLWTCNLDGSSPTQIDSENSGGNGADLFGTTVVRIIGNKIYKYSDLSGAGKTQVGSDFTIGEELIGISFSPNGSHIVFGKTASGYTQLFTMKLDGTGLTPITTGSYNNSNPVWAP